MAEAPRGRSSLIHFYVLTVEGVVKEVEERGEVGCKTGVYMYIILTILVPVRKPDGLR
jgi:hypothetical protein